MILNSSVLVLLLLIMHGIDGRRSYHSYRERIRSIWDKLTDKVKQQAVDKFKIDMRQFDKEEMLLFPDVAFQSLTNDSIWNVVIHGWRYEGSKKKDWIGIRASLWVERLAKQMISGADLLYLNQSINQDRLKPFFVDDEVNEKITIKIGDRSFPAKTDKQGQFYEEVQVSNDDIQKLKKEQQRIYTVLCEAIGDNRDTTKGIIRLMEPRYGVSVISDVDDTIKISEVLDKVRLLANTFIFPFKPVPGMAELYQKWASNNANCTFHYLSGMPDQLYTLTQEFINDNNFPDGSFHMRHFGWAASSIFTFLHSQSTFLHKTSHLNVFLANTIRDYVLIGDSGEKDPEVYATVARQYPERIRAIFIRAIKGEAFDDQRFITAFDGVPREKWQIFNDPQQLPIDLSRSPGATSG